MLNDVSATPPCYLRFFTRPSYKIMMVVSQHQNIKVMTNVEGVEGTPGISTSPPEPQYQMLAQIVSKSSQQHQAATATTQTGAS